MRAALVLVLLAACGSSGEPADVKSLPPVEACKAIMKRAWTCGEDFTAPLRKAEDQFRQSELAVVALAMADGSRCAQLETTAIEQLQACYDRDCGKLGECFLTMLVARSQARDREEEDRDNREIADCIADGGSRESCVDYVADKYAR